MFLLLFLHVLSLFCCFVSVTAEEEEKEEEEEGVGNGWLLLKLIMETTPSVLGRIFIHSVYSSIL